MSVQSKLASEPPPPNLLYADSTLLRKTLVQSRVAMWLAVATVAGFFAARMSEGDNRFILLDIMLGLASGGFAIYALVILLVNRKTRKGYLGVISGLMAGLWALLMIALFLAMHLFPGH